MTPCRCRQPNCNCAEWNAIYKAKFENPDYYGLRMTAQSSPIHNYNVRAGSAFTDRSRGNAGTANWITDQQ